MAEIEVSKLKLSWVDAQGDGLRHGTLVTDCRVLTRLRVHKHDKGR